MDTNKRIIIPGAAGLVGQNLLIALKAKGYKNILAFDKHPANTEILRKLHPDIEVIEADISQPGKWQVTGPDWLKGVSAIRAEQH